MTAMSEAHDYGARGDSKMEVRVPNRNLGLTLRGGRAAHETKALFKTGDCAILSVKATVSLRLLRMGVAGGMAEGLIDTSDARPSKSMPEDSLLRLPSKDGAGLLAIGFSFGTILAGISLYLS